MEPGALSDWRSSSSTPTLVRVSQGQPMDVRLGVLTQAPRDGAMELAVTSVREGSAGMHEVVPKIGDPPGLAAMLETAVGVDLAEAAP